MISPPPRSSLEAWQIALDHEGLAEHFVDQYLGAGIQLDDNPDKRPHRGPRVKWIRDGDGRWIRDPAEYDDLIQEARIALHKTAKTWDASNGTFSTYAAFPVAQALDRAVDAVLARRKNEDGEWESPVRLGDYGEIAPLDDDDDDERPPVKPLREPDFIDDVVEQEEDPGRKSLGNFPSTLATAGAGHSDRGHRHGTQSSDAQSSNPQSSNLTRPHQRPHIHQVFFDGAEPRPITEARYHNDARPLSAYLDRKGEKDAARLVLDMEREMVRLRAENTRLWDDLIEELTRMVRANPHEYGPDAVRQAERVRKRNARRNKKKGRIA